MGIYSVETESLSRPTTESQRSGARFTKYLMTIMAKLRLTYDGRLIYQTSNDYRVSVSKLAYNIPKRNLRTF